MAVALRMPRWGMIMEEGSLQGWLKQEGERIDEGEAIAEVESDKTVKEIESPASGVIARIVVSEGETVPVGSLLAVIASPDDSPDEIQAVIDADDQQARDSERTSSAVAGPTHGARTTGSTPGPADSSEAQADEGRKRISPAAKRLAGEHGIDWRSLSGTGAGGRIQVQDVEAVLEAAPVSAPSVSPQPAGLSPLRQAIARRTMTSIQIPQAALCREIDLTAVIARREAARRSQRDRGAHPSLTAYVIEMVVSALQQVPDLNATLTPEGHSVQSEINVGVVVSTPGGIMVPVIHGAERKSLEEIQTDLADLVNRGAEKSLASADLEGGTFTISNAGPAGIDIFQPLLNPPEVAILGVGRIRKRPVVVDDQVVPRSTAYFCLATDHRVVDAEPAGAFLIRIDELASGIEG